jgi:hypothetical protein
VRFYFRETMLRSSVAEDGFIFAQSINGKGNNMNDTAFLKAFEDCTLPHNQFPHRAHVRMAWLYLRAHAWEIAVQKITDGIRRFAAANGADSKYHETITIFWARLVSYAISCAPDVTDFETFIARYPHLLDGGLLKRHYSAEMIRSEAARHAWVEPDLRPMPALSME